MLIIKNHKELIKQELLWRTGKEGIRNFKDIPDLSQERTAVRIMDNVIRGLRIKR